MHYCHYDRCVLPDGTLPDMASITGIVKKPDCRPDVARLFEYTQSTPIFDFVSIAFAHGVPNDDVVECAIDTLNSFDEDCYYFEVSIETTAMEEC